MKPTTALLLKYESGVIAVALLGAAVQWHKGSWQSALFILAWLIALLNLPLLWYVGKRAVSDWWRNRKLRL